MKYEVTRNYRDNMELDGRIINFCLLKGDEVDLGDQEAAFVEANSPGTLRSAKKAQTRQKTTGKNRAVAKERGE